MPWSFSCVSGVVRPHLLPHIVLVRRQDGNFALQVPDGFLEILDLLAFMSSTADIRHSAGAVVIQALILEEVDHWYISHIIMFWLVNHVVRDIELLFASCLYRHKNAQVLYYMHHKEDHELS